MIVDGGLRDALLRGRVLEVRGHDDALPAGRLDGVQALLQLGLGARGADDLGPSRPNCSIVWRPMPLLAPVITRPCPEDGPRLGDATAARAGREDGRSGWLSNATGGPAAR